MLAHIDWGRGQAKTNLMAPFGKVLRKMRPSWSGGEEMKVNVFCMLSSNPPKDVDLVSQWHHMWALNNSKSRTRSSAEDDAVDLEMKRRVTWVTRFILSEVSAKAVEMVNSMKWSLMGSSKRHKINTLPCVRSQNETVVGRGHRERKTKKKVTQDATMSRFNPPAAAHTWRPCVKVTRKLLSMQHKDVKTSNEWVLLWDPEWLHTNPLLRTVAHDNVKEYSRIQFSLQFSQMWNTHSVEANLKDILVINKQAA